MHERTRPGLENALTRGAGLALLIAAMSASGCTTSGSRVMDPLPTAVREIDRRVPAVRKVLRDPTRYRLQILVGTIEPALEPDARPRLRQEGYRLDAEYFYPASTVKLFAAVVALERRNELRAESGLPIRWDSPLVFHPLFDGEQREEQDPTHRGSGTITVGHEIRKLFLVSDNEAFNRLYELVGQDRLARALKRAGLDSAWIVHRLAESRSAEGNRRSPRIEILDPAWRWNIAERSSDPIPSPAAMPGLLVGEAYLRGGERVPGPMDFSDKNRISLVDLQRGLCMTLRPDVDCGTPQGEGFDLNVAERAFLAEAMTQFPGESLDPVYDRSEYPDHHVKPFLPGIDRVLDRSRFRVLDKTGRAYGFSTQNAWIVDTTSGDGFFLAVTLYTNADGVLNDDRYEYVTVADPFLAALSEAAARWFWNQPKKK